jgi:predicted nucleotidyltransferase
VHEDNYFPEAPQHIGDWLSYTTMVANWERSQRVLAKLRERFADDDRFEGVQTIAIAGSFGRFEGSRSSDADCIVVLHDDVSSQAEVEQSALSAITHHLAQMKISAPNPEGSFAKPRLRKELLPEPEHGDMGSPSEATDIISKRMLMLLESRPVLHDAAYHSCVHAIFDRYAQYASIDTRKEHLYLLNDLVRYFRYICVNYQANFDRDYESWALRNIKLRHSRIVMYMGLLALLGEASKYEDDRKVATVEAALNLTPLDRIARVYACNDDERFGVVANLYESFLTRVSDQATRDELNGLEYKLRYDSELFSSLKRNSDALQTELVRFILARQGQCREAARKLYGSAHLFCRGPLAP